MTVNTLEDCMNLLFKAIENKHGKKALMCLVEDGDFDNYQKAIRAVEGHPKEEQELTLVTVSLDGKDLFRYPYLDVEFVAEEGKNVKTTGNKEKVAEFLSWLEMDGEFQLWTGPKPSPN